MPQEFSVSLDRIIGEHELEVLYCPQDPANIYIYSCDVNRPGLQLGGFYEYFDNTRIQIIGKTEFTFLEQRNEEERRAAIDTLLSKRPPALVISRDLELFPEITELGEKYGVPILRCKASTSAFMAKLIAFLNLNLAPRITRHGVLIEIYGEGVLILGDSGVGKSETAIELVKRGHRLVADDAVEIKKTSNVTLVGSSPDNIRHFLELRGIGIINVRQLFGMGSVKVAEKIDMVVELESTQASNELYKLNECVKAVSDSGEIYVCAAKSKDRAAVMLTHFSDDDSTPAKQTAVDLRGFENARAEICLLDKENDLVLVKEEIITTENHSLNLNLSLFSSYLIKLTKQ